MDTRTVTRVEFAVDAGASALLAAAAGFALYAASGERTLTAAAIPVLGVCLAGLRRVQARPDVSTGAAPSGTPVTDLLAEADRSLAHAEDELVLDDILAALQPDSRVVQLFAREPAPTPGQLHHKIDRHLERGSPRPAQPDASRALHDALADLRRSLS